MEVSQKNKIIDVAIHVFVWLVFLVFLVFFSPGHRQETLDVSLALKAAVTFLFFSALTFYANYFFFIEKFIFTRKLFLFIGANLLLIFLCAWLNHLFRPMFHPTMIHGGAPMHFPRPEKHNSFFSVVRIVSPFVLPVAMSVAIKITQRWFTTETERKVIENKQLESELLHLKYQLQPHFFFNSLNNIYSLVAISPEKAQDAIHNLSKLMRYLLYETGHQQVQLSEELHFLKQYIQLMDLRLTEKTKVVISFPEVSGNYQIAPLLFLPLIENAYKHGVSATHPSVIKFEMDVSGNEIYFKSENSNFPKSDLDKSGSGIGLDNLSKRLNLLYPGKYDFTAKAADGVYCAILKIKL